ncbi:MAG TPA: D-alanyl-D-alanine carboxypeptidase [Thermoanaerobaculia bacterium]|nr:D-alanyl-D-alanine carboxypeptidase [Thermoanaerobaculia bacterium]
MKHFLRFRLLLCLSLLTACATTTPRPHPIDTLLSEPPFDRAFWSVHIEDDSGRVLYSRNADKLTIPASNRKLFASAAIVDCLGSDSQLTTEIWRDGEDLILVGDGDPSLGSWRYERSDDFDRVAASLRERGFTRVRDVVADVSLFDRHLIPGSWKHGNLGADYAAPIDALAWGESEIPTNRAVPDPALHAATALRDALFARGIEVTGTPRVNTERRAWGERLLALPSPFIAHLLHAVLKNSHNLYAEMLLKRIGDGSYDTAFAMERAFLLRETRIDANAFQFADGSGLSPDDFVTPEATIRILRWMNDPSRRATWWPILAQPNNEGTLRRRLIPLEARFRGKTGTINGVNALSGIIAMPDGSYRYFCAVANHHIGESSVANRIIDAMVAYAAETSPRTPAAP